MGLHKCGDTMIKDTKKLLGLVKSLGLDAIAIVIYMLVKIRQSPGDDKVLY